MNQFSPFDDALPVPIGADGLARLPEYPPATTLTAQQLSRYNAASRRDLMNVAVESALIGALQGVADGVSTANVLMQAVIEQHGADLPMVMQAVTLHATAQQKYAATITTLQKMQAGVEAERRNSGKQKSVVFYAPDNGRFAKPETTEK